MDYEQKFLLFKKLIDKTFASYEKKYSVNFNNKTFVVKFILTDAENAAKNGDPESAIKNGDPNRIIKLTILPDSEWYEFKKQIEKYISSISFTECPICLYQKVDVKACEKCSFTICSDCVSEIIFSDNMYRCPQCRYIRPHIVDPNGSTPRLSKIDGSIWAITNVPPCENYLSVLSANTPHFYATDEWITDMNNRYE